MTDLSPAAQAVLNAVMQKSNLSPTVSVAAAALRAAAATDQLTSTKAMLQLLAIAAELEGVNEL